MSTAWVAGSVRAVSLSGRRVGPGGAHALAQSPALDVALRLLVDTPYGHDVRPGQSLAEAQHAVAATLLWHLRVLAGWQPRDGTDVMRVLTAGFEIHNVEERLRGFTGGEPEPPYHLGTLETAWSRLVRADSAAVVRQVLTTSAWGDPGGGSPRDIGFGMRLAWADRLVGLVPEAAAWARAAVAVMAARASWLDGPGLTEAMRKRAAYVLGPDPVATLAHPPTGSGTAELPRDVRWVLAEVSEPADLWRAEVLWWRRVEREAASLLRRAEFGRPTLVGAVGLLAVDAWRVRAALEVAARGGGPAALEVFDAVA